MIFRSKNIQTKKRPMKKLFLIATIAMIIQNSFAQLAYNDKKVLNNEKVYSDIPLKSVSVPQQVRDAWQKDYSSVKGEKWYQTSGGYIACYDYKNFESRVLYDFEGKVVMHSREIDSESIPASVLNFMKKKYPAVPFGKIYMNYPIAGQNVYEIQVGESWEHFDVNGNYVEDKTSGLRASK